MPRPELPGAWGCADGRRGDRWNEGDEGISFAELETRGIGDNRGQQVEVDPTNDARGADGPRGGRDRDGGRGEGEDVLPPIMMVLCVKQRM